MFPQGPPVARADLRLCHRVSVSTGARGALEFLHVPKHLLNPYHRRCKRRQYDLLSASTKLRLQNRKPQTKWPSGLSAKGRSGSNSAQRLAADAAADRLASACPVVPRANRFRTACSRNCWPYTVHGGLQNICFTIHSTSCRERLLCIAIAGMSIPNAASVATSGCLLR